MPTRQQRAFYLGLAMRLQSVQENALQAVSVNLDGFDGAGRARATLPDGSTRSLNVLSPHALGSEGTAAVSKNGAWVDR